MKYPFEATFAELRVDLDSYVSTVLSSLESEFLIMPRGQGFIDYPVFEQAYEFLKRTTHGFQNIDTETLTAAALEVPMIIIIIRTILGFTPPEWAYLATRRTGVEIPQGAIRALDRTIRMAPLRPLTKSTLSQERIRALLATAAVYMNSTIPDVGPSRLHRLDKADTRAAPDSIRASSQLGVPYAMLLYERFLGRPFAGHRDSVSEQVGDSLEAAIEDVLTKSSISFRKTKRAERIVGFDQAPDFIVPSEYNPVVVIEAKITEDDGTARDKVTRIQHLAALSLQDQPDGNARFEVVACIGGRGFGIRREDMRKLLLATRGKVFTLQTLDRLISFTRLREFTAS